MNTAGARTIRVLLLVGAVFAATTGPHATGTTATFTVFGPKTLTRTSGAPNVFNFTFTVANPSSLAYTLRIDNHGVDDAKVTLNGVQVVGAHECAPTNNVIQKPIKLRESNTLRVELKSRTGTYL